MNKFLRSMMFVFVFVVPVLFCGCFADGLSAYEIAVQNGYVGTEYEWLDSLKAENGENGEDGIDGTDGDDGVDGLDGGAWISASAVSDAVRSSVVVYSSHASAQGAGVIFRKNNSDVYIITNYHNIYKEAEYVELPNGEPGSLISAGSLAETAKIYLLGDDVSRTNPIECDVVGGSAICDVAVLHFSLTDSNNNDLYIASTAHPCEIGNSNLVGFGDATLAVGNPLGGGIKCSSGIIRNSGFDVSRVLIAENTQSTHCFCIDASVNPGNSGGGLFDKDGKLIGLVSSKMQHSLPGAETNIYPDDMGYALQGNYSIAFANSIIANSGTAKRITLGVICDYSPYATYENGKSYIRYNLEVSNIGLTTYGFQVGDIIKSITVGDTTANIYLPFSMEEVMLGLVEGADIAISVERDGSIVYIEINDLPAPATVTTILEDYDHETVII